MGKKMEYATLGGGCFWCTETIFKELMGVEGVISGYSGGHTDNPTYDQLHYEDTGHAEVIQITFDPDTINYHDILQIFFAVHDPTTPNKQGNDEGAEYRSIILFHNKEQKKIAQETIQNFASQIWNEPIVTELAEYDKFWPAENYHQNFYQKNPESGYCQIVINPKLAKFRKQFASRLKS